MSPAPLDQLSGLLGIRPEHYDIWGTRYVVADETKQALCAAMGFPAGTAGEMTESLARIAEVRRRQLLPTVRVVASGTGFWVPMAAAATAGRVYWLVTEEDGREHTGENAATDLPVLTGGYAGLVPPRRRLDVPVALPPGYHKLSLATSGPNGTGEAEAVMTVIATPGACIAPEALGSSGRSWGIAAQLYGLRGGGNWGIGDFGDLGRLMEAAGAVGAELVGVNPLHALFPADPGHDSPYGPSSRLFLNGLYLDMTEVPELAGCPDVQAMIGAPDFQRRLAAVRDAPLVDYAAVAALKLPVLERLWDGLRAGRTPDADGRLAQFRTFQAERGRPLARQGVFEALHEHFFGRDFNLWSWQRWPAPFRNPNSAEVAAFAADHADRVDFFQYLQWLADQQLGAAVARGRAGGLKVGLYRDLAVAADPGGAEAWSEQEVVVAGAGVGAPPDPFNRLGQNWGLAPFSPRGLRAAAFRPFIDMLRANMRHSGMIRVDHVMNLQRLYWIPAAESCAARGAYVDYPFQDLLGILALESSRQRCLVVGEDLGTVPEGFRPAMQKAGALSYRVLYFERTHDARFLPPEAYPRDCVVTATTHDLATLEGFWTGRDLEWRRRLRLYPDDDTRRRDESDRDRDRHLLLEALIRAGFLPPSAADRIDTRRLPPGVLEAVSAYCAATPGRFVIVTLEDLCGLVEQPNLPGTVHDHPNWRRRLPVSVAEIAGSDALAAVAAAIRRQRG